MPIERDDEESPQYGIHQAEKSSLNIPDVTVAIESNLDGVDNTADVETEGSVLRFFRRVMGSLILGVGLTLFFFGYYLVDEMSGTPDAVIFFIVLLISSTPKRQ